MPRRQGRLDLESTELRRQLINERLTETEGSRIVDERDAVAGDDKTSGVGAPVRDSSTVRSSMGEGDERGKVGLSGSGGVDGAGRDEDDFRGAEFGEG